MNKPELFDLEVLTPDGRGYFPLAEKFFNVIVENMLALEIIINEK